MPRYRVARGKQPVGAHALHVSRSEYQVNIAIYLASDIRQSFSGTVCSVCDKEEICAPVSIVGKHRHATISALSNGTLYAAENDDARQASHQRWLLQKCRKAKNVFCPRNCYPRHRSRRRFENSTN